VGNFGIRRGDVVPQARNEMQFKKIGNLARYRPTHIEKIRNFLTYEKNESG